MAKPMKTLELHYPMIQSIQSKSYCAVLSYGTICCTRWMKNYCLNIQLKSFEEYFHVVLFIVLYKVVLTFKSVDKTLVCDHSNESY